MIKKKSSFFLSGKICLMVFLTSIIILSPLEIFALGEPGPPNLFLEITPRTQKVNAGGSTIYDLELVSEWSGWFNVTVGSTITNEQKKAQNMFAGPIPEGIEVNVIEPLFIDILWKQYFVPLEITVSPDIEYSMLNLTVIILGTSEQGGEYHVADTLDILLYVVPKETSLGEVSTLFFEGFDELDRGLGSGGWILVADGGKAGLSVYSFVNHVPTRYLILNDWSSSKSVVAEHIIPVLNDSFILEFTIKSRKLHLFQLKFELQDSKLSEVFSAELTDGNILVQNTSYGQHDNYNWYRFKFEVNSDDNTVRCYIDNKYVDTLSWKGSPDKIRISTSESGIGIGEIDDIFIQKIIDKPETNSFQFWIISTAIITMLLAAILILIKRR